MSKTDEKYSYKVSLGSHDSRLKKGPAKEVVDYLYSRWLNATIPAFEEMLKFLKAHMVELHDKKIVSKDDAVEILNALKWIEEQGLERFELDPGIEDLMPNLEAILISKLGEPVGGRVLTGMARGEPMYVSAMLFLRSKILKLLDEVYNLRLLILDLADKHTESIMPGYTHVQHAQPTTLGHYFSCVAEALETDCDRLENAYKRVNMSAAGYSSAWGTSYPTDRNRIAELLGFDAAIENTRYAMLSFDRGIETLAAVTMLAVNINRLTDDIYFWCTYEFNMAELADEYASTSYIMPQKKNPYALEEYPALTNRASSELLRVIELTRLTSFGLAIHLSGKRTDTTMTPSRVIEDIIGAIKMVRGIVSTLTINVDRMRELAGINFTQSTDLSDTLVREKGLSFRTAHKIVGTLVREALGNGLKPNEITTKMLDDAAKEVIGKPVGLSDEILSKVLDPMNCVESRKGLGGVAPKAVKDSLKNRRNKLNEHMINLRNKRQKLQKAENKLDDAVKNIIGLK